MSFSNETEIILDKIKDEIYLILQLSKSCIAAQAFETRFPKNIFLKKNVYRCATIKTPHRQIMTTITNGVLKFQPMIKK